MVRIETSSRRQSIEKQADLILVPPSRVLFPQQNDAEASLFFFPVSLILLTNWSFVVPNNLVSNYGE
jgi:hypothetical protein